MTIDVGSEAINRPSNIGTSTIVDKNNSANASGKITSVEIWASVNLENCEVATFFVVSGNYLSTRDTHTIGSVTAGSKQTFSELNITVEEGDYIGIYFSAGNIEKTDSGDGVWTKAGDNTPCTNVEFTFNTDDTISLYGLGFVIIPKSISGTFNLTGAVTKLPKIILLGTLTFTGNILRNIFKSLSGVFTLTGTISPGKRFIKALSGVLSFTTSLTVLIYYYWNKITKDISSYTKTDKDISSYTKINKPKSDYTKRYR